MRIWYWIAALVALWSLTLATGCTANKVAEHGMGYRGPVKFNAELYESGDPKSVGGETDGSSGSDFMYSRKTYYDSGKTKSEALITSNQSVMQQQYFEGVRQQSQQDLTAAISVIRESTATVGNLASMAVALKTQLDALKPPPSTQPNRVEQLLEAWAAKNGITIPPAGQ